MGKLTNVSGMQLSGRRGDCWCWARLIEAQMNYCPNPDCWVMGHLLLRSQSEMPGNGVISQEIVRHEY
jgi:hypothetical protein